MSLAAAVAARIKLNQHLARSKLSQLPKCYFSTKSDYEHKQVSKEDVKAGVAPEPAKESTTESMMPWEGWFSSFVKSKIGPEKFQTLRETILWNADNTHDLHQVPKPNTKVTLSQDKEAMFRYPSPGSQPAVNIPKTADPGSKEDDPYNIAYYPKDTRRRFDSDPAAFHPEVEKVKLQLLKESMELEDGDERINQAIAKLEDGPGSSPGNQGRFATGPSDFDPSMLRASMSTNHEVMNQSLDENMPDHLPYSDWDEQQDEIVAWYEERGLMVPLGAAGKNAMYVETKYRVARW